MIVFEEPTGSAVVAQEAAPELTVTAEQADGSVIEAPDDVVAVKATVAPVDSARPPEGTVMLTVKVSEELKAEVVVAGLVKASVAAVFETVSVVWTVPE